MFDLLSLYNYIAKQKPNVDHSKTLMAIIAKGALLLVVDQI